MRTNRFLIAGLVLGGILGAGYAARYVRRQQYSALASDPLLGWNGESSAGSSATGWREASSTTRGDSMPSPTAPLGAA
ncbi:hypothetical protein [Caldimonas tepidiphila]|uniref:hypothetical protein n=1 Tax=Caldimonas tepidiphila TaxID=2315841 RepID=UPI000E5A74B0|nr:hypothetical protein [Caldimonas tepidiphila]